MGKWKEVWMDKSCDVDMDEFRDGLFAVKMRGWARLLLIGNKKRIRNLWGINCWKWKWGSFCVAGRLHKARKSILLIYAGSDNSFLVRRIKDEVRGRTDRSGYIGDFRYKLFGEYRHIAWFTLEKIEG